MHNEKINIYLEIINIKTTEQWFEYLKHSSPIHSKQIKCVYFATDHQSCMPSLQIKIKLPRVSQDAIHEEKQCFLFNSKIRQSIYVNTFSFLQMCDAV